MWNKKKNTMCSGFSIIELVLGLCILTAIMLASATYVENMTDAKRFKTTMREMKILARGILGESNHVQTGHRASFGYYEFHQGFPSQLSDLDNILNEPQSVNIAAVGLESLPYDEWGTGYVYDAPGAGNGYVSTITSYGIDRSAGGGDDIVYTIDENNLRNNTVHIYVTDAVGTQLRSIHSGDADYSHQIYQIIIQGFGGAGTPALGHWNPHDTSATNIGAITYDDGYFNVTGVQAGFYKLTVTPTLGSDGDEMLEGAYDNRPNLVGYEAGTNTESAIIKYIVVYPRGADVVQNVEVRLPGTLDVSKIQTP